MKRLLANLLIGFISCIRAYDNTVFDYDPEVSEEIAVYSYDTPYSNQCGINVGTSDHEDEGYPDDYEEFEDEDEL